MPLFLQPLPFVFLDQCCDFLAGKHQPYTCYFQSVKQYYCPFFPKITLQSANNLVVVIHNSLGLSVKFSQPDVIVHRDLVNFHDFEGSIQRVFLMKSVRSFEPDSASSFSNQLFSQHSAVNCTLVRRGTLEFLVRSCHICLLYLSDFGFILLLFWNCDFGANVSALPGSAEVSV